MEGSPVPRGRCCVTGRLPWGGVTSAPALCAGNYNLSSVLPTAPDMAQLKEGVRSVAGKLSVFANGVMTSIQVSGAAGTGLRRRVGSGCENETGATLQSLGNWVLRH